MKTRSLFIGALLLALAHISGATQADDTTITITGQNAGPTAFISQLTLTASDTSVIRSIQFTVASKPGSVVRPLSGTYSNDYMVSRGYISGGDIFLPVYGLYDDYTNDVTLTYNFFDGSSKGDSTTIATAAFDDSACGYKNPTIIQARTTSTSLSYDYFFIRSGCGNFSPVILDTDGAIRWVSTLGVSNALLASTLFYNGAVYECIGSSLNRVDLDGTMTVLGDYAGDGVVNFHHNIDPGKTGLLLESDTADQTESTIMEVDLDGTLLKTWSMADIISAAMIAGGDDPSQFVFPAPTDWFHSNAVSYNRGDDSVIISSRENFVIAIDYETGAIKWIFGDETKKWFQDFPSLAAFSVKPVGATLAPIGQHATSITFDQSLLLFDDGFFSQFQVPHGLNRTYSSPRKYSLNFTDSPGAGTEVWNFEMGQSLYTAICSSVYEDAPLNYLVDYAFLNGSFITGQGDSQILGLDAAGNTIFNYQYAATFCDEAYNSVPIHLEASKYPIIRARALNLSTRGSISSGDNALIGGFIVTGTTDKKVALRIVAPSLSNSGVSGALADPFLTLYDSTGAVIATNDDWQSDPAAAELTGDGLALSDPAESGTIQTLAPGAYTVTATSKDGSTGLGLVEAYDLTPTDDSHLANISTRGVVGTGDNALITGFIVGDVDSTTVVVRALGPSLTDLGVSDALLNPLLNIFDSNGTVIGTNDNWQQDPNYLNVEQAGLAPTQNLEAAIILHPPAGAYTAIVTGAGGGSGTALAEIYNLE